MTDIDKMVIDSRNRYRDAWHAWLQGRNSADTEKRVKLTEDLNAAEREYLEIGKRREPDAPTAKRPG